MSTRLKILKFIVNLEKIMGLFGKNKEEVTKQKEEVPEPRKCSKCRRMTSVYCFTEARQVFMPMKAGDGLPIRPTQQFIEHYLCVDCNNIEMKFDDGGGFSWMKDRLAKSGYMRGIPEAERKRKLEEGKKEE